MQKKITRIELHGNYSPKLFFDDNTKAEIFDYHSSLLLSLKEGTIITKYELYKGRFPDCPLIKIYEIIEPVQSIHPIQPTHPVKKTIATPKSEIINKEENKSIILNYQQETTDAWLKKQKQMAIQSALERSTELVCAGKLKLEELHIQAIKNFELILHHSGIETAIEKTKKEKPSPAKAKKKKVKKEETNNAPINAPTETNLF